MGQVGEARGEELAHGICVQVEQGNAGAVSQGVHEFYGSYQDKMAFYVCTWS